MNFGVPEWAVGVVMIVLVISVVQRLAGHVGPGSRRRMSADLERRLAELEEGQRQLSAGDTSALEQRIGELEERLDFAERMLAKQKDADRLGRPPQA